MNYSFYIILSYFTFTYFTIFSHISYRCTWGSDRDGQCISLACWGIRIKPEDHIFLNRTTGIFRVLQTVLDDARTSMALVSDKTRAPALGSGTGPGSAILSPFRNNSNISGAGA